MKRYLSIAVVLVSSIFLLETTSWATGMFTPTEPGYKEFGSMRKKGTVKNESLGADFGLGYYTSKMEFKDFDPKVEQRHIYAHLGYFFTDDFYMYLNFGASDMTAGNAESTFNMFGTLGAALTLFNSGFFEFGPVAQFSMYSDQKLKGNGLDSAEITGLRDINAGISFAVKPKEWLKVQAVPFVYFSRGDVELGSYSYDIREKNNVGTALTLRFYPFGDALAIDLEAQYKSGLSYGAAIIYNF